MKIYNFSKDIIVKLLDKKIFFIFKIISFLILCGFFLTKYTDFILCKKLFYHDSLIIASSAYVFFNNIFNGNIPPLWSSLINNGEPLWPTVEVQQFSFDPVAFFITSIYYFLGKSPFYAYQTVCIIWLMIFSTGGMLCSRFIYKNWWINLTVFSILFGGPIGNSIIAQNSFLTPFVYTPFVILVFLKLMDNFSYKTAIILGLLITMSACSYQSVFAFIFIFVFMFFYCFFNYINDHNFFNTKSIKCLFVSLLISVLGFMPSFVIANEYLKNLISLGRTYFRNAIYFFPPDQFILQSFLQHPENLPIWHGSSYIGILPIILVCLAIFISIFRIITPRSIIFSKFIKQKISKLSNLESTWILSTFITIILCVGLFGIKGYVEDKGSLFGVRNWGFMLTLTILCYSQLFTLGYKYLKTLLWPITLKGILFCILSLLFLIPFSISFISKTLFASYINSIQTIISVEPFFLLFFTCLIGLYILSKYVGLFLKFSPEKCFAFFCFLFVVINLYFSPATEVKTLLSNTNAPKISHMQNKFELKREWNFNMLSHSPFNFLGPLIENKNYALLDIDLQNLWHGFEWNSDIFSHSQFYLLESLTENKNKVLDKIDLKTFKYKLRNYPSPIVGPSHFFRLPRYDKLLNSDINYEIIKSIVGVSSPVIKVVPFGIKSNSFEESAKIIRKINNPDFLNYFAVVEGDISTKMAFNSNYKLIKSDLVRMDNLKILKYTGNTLKIEFNNNKKGILVYADNYTDDWKVYVNGFKKNLLIINGTNKGVLVEKGYNIVEFKYMPVLYVIAFWLRAILILIFIIILFQKLCSIIKKEIY